METQLSEPYFPIGKSSSMLQAINYFPVNRVWIPNRVEMESEPVMMSVPMFSPPETVQTTIEKPTIFTPKNIMIGAGVICLLIVIVKSK